MNGRKRIRLSRTPPETQPDPFETLPDDLLICILSKLSSSSSFPSDFVAALTVCKRFHRLGLNPLVLARSSPGLFSIRAQNWSNFALQFLKQCVNSGSVEACYFLGMIRFYCLGNRGSGASLMAKAAIRSHAPALYSLAVIQFNGSGGSKADRDLRAGVALSARAAYLGHVDALRELGHCLQDGYGIRRNVAEGRRLLVQANARELAAVLPDGTWRSIHKPPDSGLESDLLSDFGCNVPLPEVHPANRFIMEWVGLKSGLSEPGLRGCSYLGCGRPETRPHEFRRCSVCGAVNYCSRGCQAHDWKVRHKAGCTPAVQWGHAGVGHGGGVIFVGGDPDDVVIQS